ncbi:MAG: adenylate kinase [Actinomycetota bacterium]|nr:adenylate kinase [Actinomycetota bacterium]MDQ2956233.1 adenylate kinase [Actinomycetota bacterium]
MKVVLIGAPGSGKGTQGERLASASGARHIATGDLLREQVQEGTDLGHTVAGYLDSGALVPDEVLLDLAVPLARSAARANGYILDGFPRSVAQATRFEEVAGTEAAVDAVLFFQVPRAELVQRLLRRAAEQDRADDTEQVIVRRLAVFDEQTSPLIDYYRAAGLLRVIDGASSVPDVAAAVTDALSA